MESRRKPCVLCILCFVAAVLMSGVSLCLQSRVQVDYQYVIPAPADATQLSVQYEKAQEILSTLEDSSTQAVVSGRRQHAFVSSHFGSETITLYAVDDAWGSIHHDTLYEGRMITRRDVKRKNACIVLSEATARTLFPAGNALGNAVTIDGCAFEVVGLIRDELIIGEADDAVAYIPITADAIQLDTMTCNFFTASSQGASAVYETTLRAWQEGGTFHHFSQIKLSAWLPFYLTALIALLAVLMYSFRKWTAFCGSLLQKNKNDLAREYLHRVWWSLMIRGILAALLGTLLVASAWCWLRLLVYPMELFPEWMPENPAKLSSWISCVRRVMSSAADGLKYCSLETSIMKIASGTDLTSYTLLLTGVMTYLIRGTLLMESNHR